MGKLVNTRGGEIFAIPLFLSDIADNIKFDNDEFEGRGKEFAFCRIIDDLKGGGILIEVFDLIGDLHESLEKIISAKRLFPPVVISGLGIYTKRWKRIHIQENFEKEKHSKYSEIKLVLGTKDNLRIWQNGEETPISKAEAKKYEDWEIWRASHLEKRIIKSLFKD